MSDIDFSISIPNKDKFISALKSGAALVRPTMQDAISKSTAVLAKHTVRGVVPWKTGNLVQTFMPQIGDLMAIWKPTASYAPYVEFGHSQQPGRYVKALGKRLVASSVAGQPYMEKIVSESQPEIDALFAQALNIITRDMAG